MIDRLLERLPCRENAQGLDEQARAVLRLVFERAPGRCPPQPSSSPEACPNCDAPAPSLRTPYCGEACRDIAAFVRQVRTSLADESILDPGKQVAFGQTLWRLAGGGRPYRQALVLDRARDRVLRRFEGRCALCGEPAVTLDHVGSG